MKQKTEANIGLYRINKEGISMSLFVKKFSEVVEKFPLKNAIVFEGASLSYAQLDEASDGIARALGL